MVQFQSHGTQDRARLKHLLLCGAGALAAGLAQSAAAQTTEMTDLSATITAPAFVTRGEQINVSLKVHNAGPDQASVVSLRLELDAGLNIASFSLLGGSSSPTPGALGTCVSGSTVVACKLPQLPSGGDFIVSIVTSATMRAGSFAHIALVEGDGRDLILTNNSASAVTTVSEIAQGIQPGDNSGGGGGGSLSWWMLAVLLLMARMRTSRVRVEKAQSHVSGRDGLLAALGGKAA